MIRPRPQVGFIRPSPEKRKGRREKNCQKR